MREEMILFTYVAFPGTVFYGTRAVVANELSTVTLLTHGEKHVICVDNKLVFSLGGRLVLRHQAVVQDNVLGCFAFLIEHLAHFRVV